MREILSLRKTPEGVCGLENITWASTDITVGRKKKGEISILAELTR